MDLKILNPFYLRKLKKQFTKCTEDEIYSRIRTRRQKKAEKTSSMSQYGGELNELYEDTVLFFFFF